MQLVPKTMLANVPSITPSVSPAIETITLNVEGMKCAGCVKVVEQQLAHHPGVLSACVNLVTEVAVVECEVGAVDTSALAERLTAAGFPTQPRYPQGKESRGNTPAPIDADKRQRREMRSAFWQLVMAGVLLIVSSVGHLPGGDSVLPIHNIWLHCGLATVTLLGPGRAILLDGWRGLRTLAPNMNTLVGLGTLTAYTASLVALLFPQLGWECFFDEPVMLLGFILLGRTLEKQARGRAATAFKQLLALQPQVARLIANPEKVAAPGRESVEIPAEHVQVGEWLQVLPGEKIPVDGEVVTGKTTVDESMLTGESVPVLKQLGDAVTAGTLNQSGAIAMRATRTGKDTTLAQIVALVEAAQTRKAPVQRLADTVAGYFTYGVLVAAVLTFVFWYFFGTQLWPDVLIGNLAGNAISAADTASLAHQHAHNTHTLSPLLLSLKLSVAVMVVACPCALGLATPTAILVGTGVGAERGLLIKGGDVLEQVHHLDTVIFDKTGTLTTGRPTVTDCLPVPSWELDSDLGSSQNPKSFALLQLAAAAESGTSHPLAAAIQQEAHQHGLSIPSAIEFHTEPGLGISALVEGKLVLLGNKEWLTQRLVSISETEQEIARALAKDGKTVVYVAADSQLAGLIAVTDTLRPDAKAAVDQLRSLGLRVMLLTGDTLESASAVAQQLALSPADILAGISPNGKAMAIQELQSKSSRVAMVGDGINDAPALSQADVGIALQAGTDVAMETAQIVLMRVSAAHPQDVRLTDVAEAIQLSRATFNKIRQNLFWAFAYNILGIPIAAGVLLPSSGFVLSPAAAGALMAFSSVSVVTNSLLLRRL